MTSDRDRPPAAPDALVDASRLLLDGSPNAFAITQGATHVVVYANPAFQQLTRTESSPAGRRIAEVCDADGLPSLLDRAYNHALPARDELVASSLIKGATWSCTAWPLHGAGTGPYVMVALRATAAANLPIDLQRQVAERLLLGALREMEAAASAEAARERSAFLAEAGRELAESVDETETRETVSELRLPGSTTWCIVDVLERSGELLRLAIVHRDPAMALAARALENTWSPRSGDVFGAPAILDSDDPVAVIDGVDDAVAQAAPDAAHLRVLRQLGIGSLLTVPMKVRGRVLGAITFVGKPRRDHFSDEELELARALALRSAVALDNARMYGEALELKAQAQEGSRAKSEFLAHMSHELRTPLNAIAGFVDIIDLEIHGPVTAAQRSDLARIRASQQHLLVMINDILNFMQINRGTLDYHPVDVSLKDLIDHALFLVAPLIDSAKLTMRDILCPPELVVRADPDRAQQILINLLTNAVKFTLVGGEINVECDSAGDMVRLTIADTGMGIAADRLESVFEPFIQVESGLTDRTGGVGLGLAISRDLARAMGGDITAESVLGKGSRFTLSLPRAGGSGADVPAA